MVLKKVLLLGAGLVLVIGGMTLVIKDWFFIEMVFRGIIGPLLAVLGLVILVIARD